jgi:hypothetical protein
MYTPEEHEKIVRDILNTFDDHDELHIAYKTKMKEIITYAIIGFVDFIDKNSNVEDADIMEWINNFVEKGFK